MSACCCTLYELMLTFFTCRCELALELSAQLQLGCDQESGLLSSSPGSGWVQGLVPQDSAGSGGITLMLFLSSGFSPSSGKPHLAAKQTLSSVNLLLGLILSSSSKEEPAGHPSQLKQQFEVKENRLSTVGMLSSLFIMAT